ncbi:hypothetical protein AB1K56_03325 [Microbacterium sp. BWR-S6Y]|uniref:hypothetical protein n=1 Tax=Microbacterium sp. BWR-S6Y TaxID=3232073 RepID=UPI0035282FEE
MKTIRLPVTDDEYREHRAARRHERIARRALRLLTPLTRGERFYNLKTDDGYVGVLVTLADFHACGLPDGAAVRLGVRLQPVDDTSAEHLAGIKRAALEAEEHSGDAFDRVSDTLLRRLSGLRHDITALLDWALPEGVPLWRESVYLYVENSAKEHLL